MSNRHYLPADLIPGRDRLVLDDGTVRPITAAYELSPGTWAIEVAEPGAMIQVPADARVRAQRPL